MIHSMKKIVSKIYLYLVAGGWWLIPASASAATFSESIKTNFTELSNTIFGRDLPVTLNTPAVLVATFIRWFLAATGIAFLILCLYAGNKWMGAAGNEEQVDTARKTLIRATVGALISLTGFVLVTALEIFIQQGGLN